MSRQGRHDWSAGPTETQGAVASGVHNALSRSQVGAMGLLRDEERFLLSATLTTIPTELAIEWIGQQLAPELLQNGANDVRISIFGADGKFPRRSDILNLQFCGRSDAQSVASLFKTSDLCCPTENDYGVKFKAAEALSYGDPDYLRLAKRCLGSPPSVIFRSSILTGRQMPQRCSAS